MCILGGGKGGGGGEVLLFFFQELQTEVWRRLHYILPWLGQLKGGSFFLKGKLIQFDSALLREKKLLILLKYTYIPGWSFPCSVEFRLAITITTTTRSHESNESFTVQNGDASISFIGKILCKKSFHTGELWWGGGEICLNSTYTALKCEETNVLPVQEEGPE